MRRLIRKAAVLAVLAAAGCAQGPGGDLAVPESPNAAASASACAPAARLDAGRADALAGREAAAGLAALGLCPGLAGAALDDAQDDYLAGHALGRAEYCAPANAEALGRRGAPATLDCPGPLRAPFAQAYARGAASGGQVAEGAGASEGGAAAGGGGVWTPRIRPTLGVSIGSSGTRVGWGLGVIF